MELARSRQKSMYKFKVVNGKGNMKLVMYNWLHIYTTKSAELDFTTNICPTICIKIHSVFKIYTIKKHGTLMAVNLPSML